MRDDARIAGAPISWGVCEAPGWGYQMGYERVLTEMAGLGIAATETGPAGWLPVEGAEARSLVSGWGLDVVAGFVPLVLHVDDGYWLRDAAAAAGYLAATGAGMMVVAAATGTEGYDAASGLGAGEWGRLLANLEAVERLASARGLALTVHPHAGTIVHDGDSIAKVLEGSSVALCLDTGHQSIAGVDPVELVKTAADRIRHVHLKDVDSTLAHRVESNILAYSDAVRAGLYRPLGDGDVDFESVIGLLRMAGYSGWYVLEQDVMLESEPPPGDGPIADVRASRAYLSKLLGGTQGRPIGRGTDEIAENHRAAGRADPGRDGV